MIFGKINDVTFLLDLPPHMHLHPVFHVLLLEPYTTSSIPGRLTSPPPPIKVSDGSETILHTPNDRGWEPVGNLANASNMVAAFHNKYPHKPSSPSCLPTRGTRCREGGIMLRRHTFWLTRIRIHNFFIYILNL